MKINKENGNNFLEWYKANQSFIRERLYDIVILSAVKNFFSPTDEEFKVFSERITKSYMKDETHLDLFRIADFLSENYVNGAISLEEIKEANHWDILRAVIEDNIFLIVQHEKNSEISM